MHLDNLYQEVILDHYKRPEHKSLSAVYDTEVHHVNPSCGDEITVRLSLSKQGLIELTWDGVGCSISMASASVMAGLLNAKSLPDASPILEEFVSLMQSKGTSVGDEEILEDAVAFSGVSKYPARIKCALLAWMAFKDASVQVQSK
ncbi:MAG: SUF system NifU family Fe-S cluster assembly protein [Actinobacteria bacterium]|nr:SUF system NifU family Fe-S cluster assembly protein [Actinomycetota bacterium]